MPTILSVIFDILSQLVRFLGLALFGLAFGWLVLELLKKTTLWQVQIAVFLGLIGLVIAMAVFSGVGALGGLTLGLGAAILIWGLPRKPKKEEKEG